MNRKYILKSAVQVARFSRLLAKSIDLFIVFILCFVSYPFGLFLGIGYLAYCDSFHNGQSIGKKFIGLGVVSLIDGGPCSLKQSAIRNLPLILPLAFAIIPLWGWIFAGLMGSLLIFLEVYLLFTLDSGHRLGDVMADTTVIANDGHRLDLRKKKSSWFGAENLPSS